MNEGSNLAISYGVLLEQINKRDPRTPSTLVFKKHFVKQNKWCKKNTFGIGVQLC